MDRKREAGNRVPLDHRRTIAIPVGFGLEIKGDRKIEETQKKGSGEEPDQHPGRGSPIKRANLTGQILDHFLARMLAQYR